jgi:hypothetical protein
LGKDARMMYQFRSFNETCEFAKSSKIKTGMQWKELGKQGKLPKDIPNRPDHVYKNKGWTTWGDFLGTGFVMSSLRKYRDFDKSREFTHKLNFKSRVDWQKYLKSGKKPKDIPNKPDHVYKNKGWKGWGDFLGTGNMSPSDKALTWLSFIETRKFTHSLNLTNQEEWHDYCKSGNKPDNIPTTPNTAYKKTGWVSWGDFLGTGFIAHQKRKYGSFEITKKIIQDFNIKNISEWNTFAKSKDKPDNIPANPPEVYKDQWTTWGDWLGTNTVANQNKEFLIFEKVQEFVQKLNFKNREEWEKYSKSGKKPDNIPANPGLAYKNKGWKGWGYFLGTGRVANQTKSKNYLSWPEAKKEYRRLHKEYGLNNQIQWVRFASKHEKLLEKLSLPAAPWRVYTKEKVWRMMQK